MADIVGLVASVLQLLDTVSQARDYIQDFRNAPKDQQELLREITHLQPLLKEVDKRIQSNSPALLAGSLQDFKEPLAHLNAIMEKLAKNLAPDGIAKLSSRLVWPLWGKTDVEEGMNTIERFKTLLNAWLAMHNSQAGCAFKFYNLTDIGVAITYAVSDVAGEQRLDHQYIIRTVKHSAQETERAHTHMITTLTEATEEHRIEHNYISKSVRDVARKQEWYHESAERDQIIEWYSPLNFFLRQADIFNSRQPGTGQWLLEHDTFKKWKSGSGNMIWCRGMPGAGKTVLVSIIVDILRTELESHNIGVAAIYLNHKETDAQSPSKLLASLWRQLVFRKPIWSTIHQLYEKHHEPRTRPSLDEDQAVLCSIIAEYSKVFILVDALDEYPEMQRDVLLRLLCTLGPGVNLLVTSRPHITIDHVTLSSRLSKHIRSSPDLREAIEAKIIQRSDGMFLLAKLHIDSLATKLTVKAVREALNSLPRDLSGTFDEVVYRINRQSEEEKTGLAPLAVEEGSTELNTENLLDTETILSVCAGLVIIHTEDNRREFPHAHSRITMACITYLLFDTFPRRDIGYTRCKYLFSTNSLLDYAVNYTLIHAHGQPEYDLKEKILSFLDQCSGWVELWNWSHRLERIPNTGTRVWIAAFFDLQELIGCLIPGDGVESRAVYMAIVRGHTDMARILVGSRPYIEALGEYYASALQFAISKGKEETLRLLLERSVGDLDVTGGPHGRALQAAVSKEDLTTVKLLIEHDISIKWAGARRLKLLAASEDIAKLLIKYGLDTDAGGWRSSGLKAASLVGREAIAKLLIESGADVNATSEQADWGHQSVILGSRSSWFPPVPVNSRNPDWDQGTQLNFNKLVVGNLPLLPVSGAEGGLTSECLESALWEVFGSCDGFRRIVFCSPSTGPGCIVEFEDGRYATETLERLSGDTLDGLIHEPARFQATSVEGTEHPVNTDIEIWATGGPYGSALQAASNQGHEAIVRLLIDHGADINASGGRDGNALQAASVGGQGQIVQLLIKHGADVNSSNALQAALSMGNEQIVRLLIKHGADVDSSSVLHAALSWGNEGIVRLLIEHGADINSTDALQAASSTGNEEMVRLLIQHGANVNISNALNAASSWGHEQIVRLLIEHGANVNSTDAMQAAASMGNEKIVKLLIEHGADVSCSALQAASWAGHEQSVRILMEHGADIISTYVLRQALWAGREPVVRLLVQHGADVNSTDALEAASSTGNEQMVQLLIQHGANVNTSNALNMALSRGYEHIVRLLIKHGADINSTTALEGASKNGHEQIVRLLIQHGADITPDALKAASSWGHWKIVRLLIQHGANVNSSNVLNEASSWGHWKIVRLLLEHGADVNSSNALNEASSWGHFQIVRLLLDHGADVNSSNALNVASPRRYERIVRLLIKLKHGVDMDQPIGDGNALYLAALNGHEAIAALLILHGADMYSRGPYGDALQAASLRGHERIVRLLKKHRVDHTKHSGNWARTFGSSHPDSTSRPRKSCRKEDRPESANIVTVQSLLADAQTDMNMTVCDYPIILAAV
ncbi:ankyrin repeat-containing domain protein [Mycena epipterygia]|nr:ankyrin repeat-containing domain protein [Mycena epipterygia]